MISLLISYLWTLFNNMGKYLQYVFIKKEDVKYVSTSQSKIYVRLSLCIFKMFYFYFISGRVEWREKGREIEKEGHIEWERNINQHAFCKRPDHRQSTQPTAQACAVTGNQTGDIDLGEDADPTEPCPLHMFQKCKCIGLSKKVV